jgi:hypothetical protein
MGMQTDVLASHEEVTGTVVSGRYRLKGIITTPGGTAGDIIFRDGGASGTLRLQYNVSTNQAGISTLIPGEGILFTSDIHVTLPTATKVTVFYG